MTRLQNEALSALYSAAMGQESWQSALAKTCELFHTEKGILFTENLIEGRGAIWEVTAIERRYVDSYQRYYAGVEPLAPAAHRAGLNKGQILTIPRLVSEDDFRRSEYFNDFWRPQGIHSFLGFIDPATVGQSTPFIHLTYYRPESGREFGREDQRRLSMLRYHLRQALNLREFASPPQTSHLKYANWLVDAIAHPALVVDNRLRIVAVNRSAHAVAAKGWLLKHRNGAIQLGDGCAPLSKQLRGLLSNAFDTKVSHIVLRDDTGAAASVSLHPATELNKDGSTPLALIVLRTCDPDAGNADLALMQQCFGLTPREAEISFAIAQGLKAADICETFGIGRETFKTHKKRLFGKLGVDSQVKLTSMLTKLLT